MLSRTIAHGRIVKYEEKINGANGIGGGGSEDEMPWIKRYIIYAFPFSTTKQ